MVELEPEDTGGGVSSSSGSSGPEDLRGSQEFLELPGPILFIAPEPFYEDRGTPIAVGEVLKALSENGRRVHLLTYPMGRSLDLPGLTVHRIPNPLRIRRVPIGFSLRKVLLDVILIGKAWFMLRSTDYSCIHALEEMGFPAVILGRRAGVPVLWDMHSDMPDQMSRHRVFGLRPVQALLRRCERWLIRRAGSIICSAGLQAKVEAVRPGAPVWEWQFPGQPVHADSDSIDALRRRLGIPATTPVVAYAGSFEAYQGLPLLVEAARHVLIERPDTVFVLVGGPDGGLGPGGSRALLSRGAIRFEGRQPRHAMPVYLGLANVLVSPRTGGDNIPLKIFDYMASGRAIVATDIAAHRAILNPDRALLVDPTPEALAEGILHLLDDPGQAEVLGDGARSYTERHFTWMAFSQTVARLHPDLLLRHGRGEGV